eukprot:NODE_517_length_902_cov_908.787808_g393_i0.p1 GENE.NODE_517_length_902_cov_908.787808_g393_i0~~NODE_517_length_902_cov_908.787808_g393_i0.p1  ORF type:complete len:263 (+),score=70.40 NODE_517_length_902_cov_908.787808_g393_i0:31-789(+)
MGEPDAPAKRPRVETQKWYYLHLGNKSATIGCLLCQWGPAAPEKFMAHLQDAKHVEKAGAKGIAIDEGLDQFLHSVNAMNGAAKGCNGLIYSHCTKPDGKPKERQVAAPQLAISPQLAVSPVATITCPVCNVPCSGQECFNAHLVGKQHAKNMGMKGMAPMAQAVKQPRRAPTLAPTFMAAPMQQTMMAPAPRARGRGRGGAGGRGRAAPQGQPQTILVDNPMCCMCGGTVGLVAEPSGTVFCQNCYAASHP